MYTLDHSYAQQSFISVVAIFVTYHIFRIRHVGKHCITNYGFVLNIINSVSRTITWRSRDSLCDGKTGFIQSVLNAAARLIYRTSLCQHVTPLLRELHWLRSRERVDFKLAVLIFRCLHGLAPCYLTDDIRRVADTNRRCLRSSSSALLTVRSTWLVIMGDRAFPGLPAADFGTVYRTTSPLLPRPLFSAAV